MRFRVDPPPGRPFPSPARRIHRPFRRTAPGWSFRSCTTTSRSWPCDRSTPSSLRFLPGRREAAGRSGRRTVVTWRFSSTGSSRRSTSRVDRSRPSATCRPGGAEPGIVTVSSYFCEARPKAFTRFPRPAACPPLCCRRRTANDSTGARSSCPTAGGFCSASRQMKFISRRSMTALRAESSRAPRRQLSMRRPDTCLLSGHGSCRPALRRGPCPARWKNPCRLAKASVVRRLEREVWRFPCPTRGSWRTRPSRRWATCRTVSAGSIDQASSLNGSDRFHSSDSAS